MTWCPPHVALLQEPVQDQLWLWCPAVGHYERAKRGQGWMAVWVGGPTRPPSAHHGPGSVDLVLGQARTQLCTQLLTSGLLPHRTMGTAGLWLSSGADDCARSSARTQVSLAHLR